MNNPRFRRFGILMVYAEGKQECCEFSCFHSGSSLLYELPVAGAMVKISVAAFTFSTFSVAATFAVYAIR